MILFIIILYETIYYIISVQLVSVSKLITQRKHKFEDQKC